MLAPRPLTPRPLLAALVASLAWAASANPANAQLTWDPNQIGSTGGGPGDWNVTDPFWFNGTGYVPWANASDAVFGGLSGGTVVIGSPGMTAGSLTFNTTGYVLNDTNSLGFVTAAPPTVTVAPGVTATINTALTGTIATFTKAGTGVLVLGGANTFTTGPGLGSVVNVAAGTLSVSADANLGEAPTAAAAGRVNLATGTTLQLGGTWTLNANRGVGVAGAVTLEALPGANVAIASAVAGTITSVTKSGTGTLALSGTNTFAVSAAAGSVVNVAAGTLSVSADANLGAAPTAATNNRVNLSDGTTLQLTGGTWTLATNRRLSVSGATTINLAAGVSTSHAGVIANFATGSPGSLTVTGDPTGNLTLTGASTYTGGFTLAGGRVTLTTNVTGGASSILGNGTVTLGGGILGHTGGQVQRAVTFNGNVTTASTLATGLFQFTNGGNAISNNPTITLAGTVGVQFTAGLTLNSDVTFAGANTFAFTGATGLASNANRTLTLTTTSTGSVIRNQLAFGTNTLTLKGTSALAFGSGAGAVFGSTGGVVVDGAAATAGGPALTVTFGNAGGTFTGGVRVVGGVAAAAASSVGSPMTTSPFGLGQLRVSGGVVRGSATQTVGNDLLVDGDAAFGTGGTGLTFTSTATGAAQVIAGDRTLTFDAGVTSFTPGNGTSVSVNGNLTFAGAGTAAFGNIDFNGGARAFTKTGTGSLNFNGPTLVNVVAGSTTAVSGGTVGGTGAVAGALAVNPGGAVRGDSGTGTGALTLGTTTTVTGDPAVGAGGAIAVQLTTLAGPPAAITANSTLAVGPNVLNLVSTSGPFVVRLLNDAGLTADQAYSITIASITAGGVFQRNDAAYAAGTNAFTPADFAVVSGSGAFDYGATSLTVAGNDLVLGFTPTPVPEPASILGAAAAVGGLIRWGRRRAVRCGDAGPRAGEL